MDGLRLLLAAPAIVGVLAWIVLLGTARASGTHPLWDVQPRSLAEAAALRDSAAIVRFMSDGPDADQITAAIEAARATRDAEILQLVLDEAARAGGQ